MKIKFKQDFQGVETREVFYKRGQVVDLPDHMATRLIHDGRAEPVAASIYDSTPQFSEADPPRVEKVEPVEPVMHTEEERPKMSRRRR